MKTIFFFACFLSSCVCCPARLLGQESLLTKTIKGTPILYSVAFSPDGKYLASSGAGNTLKIWRLEDGACVKTLTGHKSFVNSVAFSPDGKRLASASEDATVKIWDVASGACINTLKGHKDFVLSAVFFPDGKRLASVSADGTLKLWRADSDTPYKTLKGHSGYVYSVAVSPDGKQLASAGVDRTIKIWNAESGTRELTLEGHKDAVNSVFFSPKGIYLASGSDDGSVKLWRLKDGLCVKTFTAGRTPVLSVAYSPDGAYVFSGGADNAVNAWSVSGSERHAEFKGHGGQVKSVAISPDGNYLASGSFDKTIKLWLTPWEADRRSSEIQAADETEAKKDSSYAAHYSAGLLALSTPTLSGAEKSFSEFTQALTFRKTEECRVKLAEAGKLLNIRRLEAAKALKISRAEELLTRQQNERQMKQRTILGVKCLSGILVFLLITRAVSRARRKTRFKKSFPVEIKLAAVSGDYTKVFEQYRGYTAIGGETGSLSPEDLLRLYYGIGDLDRLPRAKIPYSFLLSYAAKFANAGDYKTAAHMLRSGQLLDEFTEPGDYDAFVGIFVKAGRPEHLLMRKFKAATYSALAEAFFRSKDYVYCKKVCDFKKQFYASRMSRRDKELMSLSQAAAAPAATENPAT